MSVTQRKQTFGFYDEASAPFFPTGTDAWKKLER